MTNRASQPWDDAPVTLTHYQLVKCGAIVDAALRGHVGFVEGARDVAYYLQVCANKAVFGSGFALAPEDVWPRIEELPWPPPGLPRAQPD